VARGGVRTIYKITAAGRAEFRETLQRQFDEEGPVSQTLYGALLFLHLCDPAATEASVRRRIARLDTLIAEIGPLRKTMKPMLTTGGDHLLRHIEKQRELDRDWLKGLLTDLKARRIRDVADPRALAAATPHKPPKKRTR
jgi:DNA-binding PadR family transcriptional regulator